MDIALTNEIKQMNQMAAMYSKLGKFELAEKVYQALIMLERREHGQLSNEVARTNYDLAESMRRRGEDERARPFYQQAISIWDKLQRLDLLTSADCTFYLDASSILQQSDIPIQQSQTHAQAEPMTGV